MYILMGGIMQNGTYATGFCWNCGLPCANLFCNEKCGKRYATKNNINVFVRMKRSSRVKRYFELRDKRRAEAVNDRDMGTEMA
jgi:hypothetical protein